MIERRATHDIRHLSKRLLLQILFVLVLLLCQIYGDKVEWNLFFVQDLSDAPGGAGERGCEEFEDHLEWDLQKYCDGTLPII